MARDEGLQGGGKKGEKVVLQPGGEEAAEAVPQLKGQNLDHLSSSHLHVSDVC